MNPVRAGLLGLAAALATACSSAVPADVLEAWVGRPAQALRQDWGPPTRELTDGDLAILVYEQAETKSQPDLQNPVTTPEQGGYHYVVQKMAAEAYRNLSVYARSYLFWVDRSGVIVRSAVHEP